MAKQPGSVSLERKSKNYNFFKNRSFYNVNKKSSLERTLNNRKKESTGDESYRENFKRLDNYDTFFTTQQLASVDFSNFENHVFFDSAVSKVQYSYFKILNEFPYDKSEYEINQFMSSLDGFTRFIFDNKINKNIGYLKFDGNNELFIPDKSGALLEDFVGETKIGLFSIDTMKFCFEFWLYIENLDDLSVPECQIIFQKKDDFNNGITIFIENFLEEDNKKYCDLCIIVTKDNSFYKNTTKINIGNVEGQIFNHINISSYVAKGKKIFKTYINGKRQKSINVGSYSSNTQLGLDFAISNAFIGNGLSHTISRDNSLNVNRTSGLIGIIDDFRFYVGNKTDKEILDQMYVNVFSDKRLKAYYRFNEPEGNYLNNSIVLDYSGNKVHGLIRNHNTTLYNEDQIASFRNKTVNIPLIYEDVKMSPVMFPNFSDTLSSQSSLLEKAEAYDDENPNIIWNFFPKNIFIDNADSNLALDVYVSNEEVTIKKNAKKELFGVDIPANNALINIVLIWARFFDNIKCYLDQITDIIDYSYDSINNNNIDSIFIKKTLETLGIDFKEVFPHVIKEKLDGKNLQYDQVISDKSIRKIQNILWKRFIINSQDYLKSKGTAASIKSVFNSFGLEPDLFVNIREFNAVNSLNMSDSFVEKITNLKYIDFNNNSENQFDQQGFINNNVSFISKTNNNFDFSNNWSLEFFIKYDKNYLESFDNKQSLLRLEDLNSGNPYVNLIFERSKSLKNKGTLKLYVNEENLNSKVFSCEIKSVPLFEGKIFYININKKNISSVKSNYELICSMSDFGSQNQPFNKSKVSVDHVENSTLDNIDINIGSYKIHDQVSQQNLNNLDFESNFEGQLYNIKLWKKYLISDEINMHRANMLNSGLKDINISTARSDLLINVSLRESFDNNVYNSIVNNELVVVSDILTSESPISNVVYVDTSSINQSFVKSNDYILLEQSPEVDYNTHYTRVNSTSYSEQGLVDYYDLNLLSPVHEIDDNEERYEDIRVSIDFSTSNFINKELSKLLIINDYFTKTLSNSSSLYDDTYQSLYELRNVFYEKLESEINIKQLYQVYKYFDELLEELLKDAIPAKVHYHGFNFVVESNISERHKYVYKMSDARLGLNSENLDFNRYSQKFLDKDYWENITFRSDTFGGQNNNVVHRKSWGSNR